MRVLWIVLPLMVVGCQKSANETTVKTPEGTVTVSEDKVVVETKKGRTTIETGEGQTRIESDEGTTIIAENKVPEGFPIPVMPEAVVETSSHVTPPDGRNVYQLTLRVAAGVEQVAEFYEQALEDRGFKTSRTDQTNDAMKMIMVIGDAEGLEAMTMIVKEPGSDHTTATISWATREKAF